jgi:hypothetical protein
MWFAPIGDLNHSWKKWDPLPYLIFLNLVYLWKDISTFDKDSYPSSIVGKGKTYTVDIARRGQTAKIFPLLHFVLFVYLSRRIIGRQ